MQIIDNDSGLDTLENIYSNTKIDDPLRAIAQAYEDQLDALPDLPNEAAPEYAEVERRLCQNYDALEGDFFEAVKKELAMRS